MKERGVSQRVNRITSIDLQKPVILDNLHYVNELYKLDNHNVSVPSLVKSQKMLQYKLLIAELLPIVQEFGILRNTQTALANTFSQLTSEVEMCIEKTSAAVRASQSMYQELENAKSKKYVLESILAKIEPQHERVDSEPSLPERKPSDPLLHKSHSMS